LPRACSVRKTSTGPEKAQPLSVAQSCYNRSLRQVVFSDTALRLLKALPKTQQAAIKDGVRVHLGENDPAEESRNRFRLRRAAPQAEFELRVGDLRVFYRISGETVEVVLIGRKQGERLWIGGEEFEL
jgi:mRNA interferase RelE/StbE